MRTREIPAATTSTNVFSEENVVEAVTSVEGNVVTLNEDEITFEFKISDLEQLIIDIWAGRKRRVNSATFLCNQIPWLLQLQAHRDNDVVKFCVSLFCDYKSTEFKDLSIASNYELLLLSQVEGVDDKSENLEYISILSDDSKPTEIIL